MTSGLAEKFLNTSFDYRKVLLFRQGGVYVYLTIFLQRIRKYSGAKKYSIIPWEEHNN